jgi:prevent-host-death family protein
MATAGVAQLKASLSRYLARVKAGEELVVTERGRPVAKLVPIRDHEAGAGWARLSAMKGMSAEERSALGPAVCPTSSGTFPDRMIPPVP